MWTDKIFIFGDEFVSIYEKFKTDPFLGIYPTDTFTHLHEDLCIKIFSIALLVVKKNRNNQHVHQQKLNFRTSLQWNTMQLLRRMRYAMMRNDFHNILMEKNPKFHSSIYVLSVVLGVGDTKMNSGVISFLVSPSHGPYHEKDHGVPFVGNSK